MDGGECKVMKYFFCGQNTLKKERYFNELLAKFHIFLGGGKTAGTYYERHNFFLQLDLLLLFFWAKEILAYNCKREEEKFGTS